MIGSVYLRGGCDAHSRAIDRLERAQVPFARAEAVRTKELGGGASQEHLGEEGGLGVSVTYGEKVGKSGKV